MTFKSNKQRKCVMAQLNTTKSEKLSNRMKVKKENTYKSNSEIADELSKERDNDQYREKKKQDILNKIEANNKIAFENQKTNPEKAKDALFENDVLSSEYNGITHREAIEKDSLYVDTSKGNYMVVDENNKIESGLKGISKEEAEQIKKDIVERRSKRSEQIYNREFGRSKNLKVVEINSKYPAKHQGYDIREDTYGSNEKRFIVSKKGIDVARVNSPNEAIDKINSGKIKLT